jgi:hypothetical protein
MSIAVSRVPGDERTQIISRVSRAGEVSARLRPDASIFLDPGGLIVAQGIR